MNLSRRIFKISATALALTFPVAAQDATAQVNAAPDTALLAPRTEIDGQIYDVQIEVSGFGIVEQFSDPPLRTPQALADPRTWFDAAHPLTKAHLASPDGLRWSRVNLHIDARGNVSACDPRQYAVFPLSDEALCSALSQQKFLPALSQEGTRTKGQFALMISPRREESEPSAPRLPLVNTAPREAAMLQTVAPRLVPYRFPPNGMWMRKFFREPEAWRSEPARGWDGQPEEEPASGIVLSSNGTELTCGVAKRSGDPTRDERACALARERLAPEWPGATPERPHAVPLYVLGTADEPIFMAPPKSYRRKAEMASGAENRLIEALNQAGIFPDGQAASPLRLALIAQADGAIRACRVVKTTGADDTDVAACKIARSAVTMDVREDSFGRALPKSTIFWDAATKEQ